MVLFIKTPRQSDEVKEIIMRKKGKRIYDYDTLVVGQKYYVYSCGRSGNLIYCGIVHINHRIVYLFTYGETIDNFINSLNIADYKSGLRVYETTEEEPIEETNEQN